MKGRIEFSLFLFFAVSTFSGFANASIDNTLTEEASGHSVVEATLRLVHRACVFPDDKLFSRRLAYVESNDGLHPRTFRQGYYGGIWQVRSLILGSTKYFITLFVARQ